MEVLASFPLQDRFKVLLRYVPLISAFIYHTSVLKMIGVLNSTFEKSAVIGFKTHRCACEQDAHQTELGIFPLRKHGPSGFFVC